MHALLKSLLLLLISLVIVQQVTAVQSSEQTHTQRHSKRNFIDGHQIQAHYRRNDPSQLDLINGAWKEVLETYTNFKYSNFFVTGFKSKRALLNLDVESIQHTNSKESASSLQSRSVPKGEPLSPMIVTGVKENNGSVDFTGPSFNKVRRFVSSATLAFRKSLGLLDGDNAINGNSTQVINTDYLHPYAHALSHNEIILDSSATYDALSPDMYKRAGRLAFQVTNIPKTDASKLVKVYVHFPDTAYEPYRIIRNFEKHALDDGVTHSYAANLLLHHLTIWDFVQKKWIVPSGKYTINVGTSPYDIKLSHTFQVN